MKHGPQTARQRTLLFSPIGQATLQQELSWKTQMLQDYVNNAAIGLHWVDRHGIIKWANAAEMDLLGYTEEEYIGHHISEFHVYTEKIADILRRLSANETLHQYESELRCKDGSIKTVQISSNVFWHEGRFIHTRCFTIDVTETKKLFNALQASENRLQQLLATVPAGLFTCDPSGRLTFFNEEAVRLWTYRPQLGEEASAFYTGSSLYCLDGAPLTPDQMPMLTALRSAQAVNNVEVRVGRADGSHWYASLSSAPLKDSNGGVIGTMNTVEDVTPIKELEARLQESKMRHEELMQLLEKKIEEKTADLVSKNIELGRSEERYHKMIEEVEDYAIILLDKDGVIQNWNKGAEKIKGYREEDIVGKSISEFYLPEDRAVQLPEQILEEAWQNGKALYEGWRRRKDGSRFWGSIVLTALHDEHQQVIGFSKVTRDLTQKKLSEDRLQEYLTELEFKNKELEQFTYAASHDMKEPLRKIAFYISAVSEKLAGQIDEKSAEFLHRTLAAATRMNGLIEDLLSYAQTNRSDDNFEWVDLQQIVDEIILQHREEFEQKKVLFETGQLGSILGIAFQVRQLLENLIHNAVKYRHPERRSAIRIQGTPTTALPEGRKEPGSQQCYYHLSVCDNGIGFEQTSAEKIFDIFQRLDNASGTKGSGIGLAICKRIVENHKGIITATGKENEGACFDIYFPGDGPVRSQ